MGDTRRLEYSSFDVGDYVPRSLGHIDRDRIFVVVTASIPIPASG